MGQSANEIPEEVRNAVVSRLKEAPVSIALLFGSYVTGETTSGSDIDFVVEYDNKMTSVSGVHLSLVADLTRILGHDDVDIVNLSRVDPRIAIEAIEYGELLIGVPAEARRLHEQLERASVEQKDRVKQRVDAAEQKIEQRIPQREHG